VRDRTFFATSVGDGEGAIIKFNNMFITVEHVDRRIDGQQLGNQARPRWATHKRIFFDCVRVPRRYPDRADAESTIDKSFRFSMTFCMRSDPVSIS
jgi:hypothetical protein